MTTRAFWLSTMLVCSIGCAPNNTTRFSSAQAGYSGVSGGSAGWTGSGGNAPRAGTTGNAGGSSAGNPGEPGAAGTSPEDLGGAGGAGESPRRCSPAAIEGLPVFSSGVWDPLGYPPYAIDDCRLVYVAPEGGGGALYLRDMQSGTETLLEAAAAHPRRPVIAGDTIAWELDAEGKSQVRVQFAGKVRDVTGDFDHAGEPRVTRDALVFTAFRGPAATDDTDVLLFDLARDRVTVAADGPGQQRFADISNDYVALTDFSEDPRGYFDASQSISDVVVVDRNSGMKTTRKREGKQAFPLLGKDGALVYLDWGAVHPEPKFSQFSLRGGNVAAAVELDVDLKGEPIHTDPAYVRPSLRGLTVDFVDMQPSGTGLYHVTLGTGAAPQLVPATAQRLFGPVAEEAYTLVGSSPNGQVLSLMAVYR